jgi:hypothetical protein
VQFVLISLGSLRFRREGHKRQATSRFDGYFSADFNEIFFFFSAKDYAAPSHYLPLLMERGRNGIQS